MTLHDWLNVAVLLANTATLVMCIVVLWRLNQLHAWVIYVRAWMGDVNQRLKELEDWIQK